MARRIGILGGTFDPIHYGHLFLAEEARWRFHLDQVCFVPAGTPPHKLNAEYAPAAHRLAMAEEATRTNPQFSVSDIEVARGGISYTVDTLKLTREQNPDAELYYLTGIDTAAEITTWRSPSELVRLATIVAVARPGYDTAQLMRGLPGEYAQRICVIDSVKLDISSTDIRARIRSGQPVRYLTPDAVLEYISTQDLYGSGAAKPFSAGEQPFDE